MERVGTYDSGRWTREVAASGGYAFLASDNSGLLVIDISDPRDPQLTGRHNNRDSARRLELLGEVVYVANENSLEIIDVGDPANPQRIFGIDFENSVADVAIVGSFAFLAMDEDGFQVIDTSIPANPQRVGTYQADIELSSRNIVISGNLAFMASHSYANESDGLRSPEIEVIDVTNSESPRFVSRYHAGTSRDGGNIAMSGNLVYLAAGSDGMHIVDFENPAVPQVKSIFDSGLYASGDIEVSNQLVFLAGGSDLEIINVSDPENPTLSGFIDLEERIQEIAVFSKWNFGFNNC